MDEAIFTRLEINSQARKKDVLGYKYKRYLFEKVFGTPKEYFAGISGLRGIGKTVMLLQMANKIKNSLYFSADSSYLKNESIYDLVRHARGKGYKDIFIDEIYYGQNWQADLKTLYDEGEVRVFFSGSSALEIQRGADLARRALIFNMKPTSFREFLIINKGMEHFPPISAASMFDFKKRKQAIFATSGHSQNLGEYFKAGGLPYYKGNIQYFYKSLERGLEKIIQSDLAYLRAIDTKIENSIYAILRRIAMLPSGETSYSAIASSISLSKPTVIRIIDDLVKIGIVMRILPCGKASVRKEPKLFLAFPYRSYFHSIAMSNPDIGSLREEFFAAHATGLCYLKGNRGEKTPDFLFNGKKVEVGGAGKGFGQGADFLLKDSLTLAKNEIPLYLAGFLY